MDIYLIRHTSLILEPGICYGISEIDVSSSFEEEKENIINKLPKLENFSLFSSQLLRCRKLAEALSHGTIEFSPLLNEFNYGDWEMKKWTEIDNKLLNEYMNGFVNFRVPGGDTYFEVTERVKQFMSELFSKEIENTVIVTHSGIIAAFLSLFIGLPIEKAAYFRPNYGSITKLVYTKDYRFVDYVNR